METYIGHIANIRKNTLLFSLYKKDSDDTLFEMEVKKSAIKEKYHERISLGKVVKVNFTNKGGVSIFIYPDKKYTKKDIKKAKVWADKIYKQIFDK